MELNFDKLKIFPAATLIQIIFGVIAPGFLFLFVFKRDLFLTLDLFRLSAIAIALTAPIFSLNLMIVMMLTNNEKEYEDENQLDRHLTASHFGGSFLSSILIFTSIIFGYFFQLTIKQGILILIALQIIIIILFLIKISGEPKGAEKSKNK